MKKRVFSTVLAVLLITCTFLLPIANAEITEKKNGGTAENVTKSPAVIVAPPKKDSETSKTEQKTENNGEKVTYIVSVNGDSLLDTVIASNGKYKNVSELVLSEEGKTCFDTIKKNQAVVKASIQKLIPESDFSGSCTYFAAINGFSVKAGVNSKEKIEKINGVRSVSISDSDISIDVNADSATVSSMSQSVKSLINANSAYESGLDGSGILIAVIDVEINTAHEAFSQVPRTLKYSREQIDKIYRSVSFNTDKKYSSSDVFKSDKIVYAYDYAENDTDTSSSEIPCHGTHIAATAAGNNGKDGEEEFKGTAYNAQLAVMKVSGENSAVNVNTMFAALDDAVKIGADVINISLGNERNTGYYEIFEETAEKLSQIGTAVVCSAGNGGYNQSFEQMSTSDIDYGTLGFMACYDTTLSVGASENNTFATKYFTIDEGNFYYYDLCKGENELSSVITEPTEYVYLTLDEEGKFDYTDTEGKIIVAECGENIDDVENMIETTFLRDIKALILIQNDDFPISEEDFQTEKPVAVSDSENLWYFEYYPYGTITPHTDMLLIESETENGMSKSSSWGVTPDLKLKPEITAPGVNVYSANSDGSYGYMSGTSAAVPFVAGSYALVKQYLQRFSWFSSVSAKEQKKMITALLMNNAEPLKYNGDEEEEIYISPRKQGSGIVNADKSVSSEIYITTEGSDKPKADLGDSLTGEYSFTFSVHNISDTEKTFALYSAVQTDKAEFLDGKMINTLLPYPLNEKSEVTFTVDGEETESITTEPYGTAEVNVSIKLDALFALEYSQYFKNGFYVDGYIFLENEESRLNIPFMGFCGDWGNISPFDYTVYDAAKSVSGYKNFLVAGGYSGIEEPLILGSNQFTGEIDDRNIAIGKDTLRSYYDSNALKNTYILPDFYMLRDVYEFTVSVSDKNGKQLFSHNYGSVSSLRDEEPYRKLVSDSDELMKFFSELSDGEYVYTVSARTMKSDGTLSDKIYSVSFDFIQDNKKPENAVSKTFAQEGKVLLELSAYDKVGIQGFELYTAIYNSKTNQYDYADKLDELIRAGYISEQSYYLDSVKKNKDGSVTYLYDITELYGELIKLKFITKGNIATCSSLKIAYKAFDRAYNATSAKTADTVAYGSAELTFKDQNGRAVKDVAVRIGDREGISDENGKVLFEQLLSDFYLAEIESVPENYSVENRYFIIDIGIESLEYKNTVTFDFTGEYPESSETEESSQQTEETQQPEEVSMSLTSETKEEPESDNSLYAFGFVGVLLLICTTSLIISKKRRKFDE